MELKLNKDFLSMLDAPWLKKQVETHLVFGFCSRQVPFALLYMAACVIYIIYNVMTSNDSVLNHILNNSEFLFFIIGGLYLLKLPQYYQAAIGWWTIKGLLALCCPVVIIGYGLVGFFKGSPDAIHITLMMLIWVPSLEFVPSLTEKQKYITIARVIVSIPLLILWYRTGTWN
jgi:hypothetical protein